MKYAFRKRARTARLAVGLLALAVPFVGASVAQGAIGQTDPANTAAPDLTSARIVGLGGAVEVCWDQPVDLAEADGADIVIGGYKSNDAPVTSATQTSAGAFAFGSAPVSLGNNCVRTQIGETDLEAYTIASVAAGTVQNEADNRTNLEDSTPLLGAGEETSQNGTRGNTTAPDLTSVLLLGPENDIVYFFDQDLDCDQVEDDDEPYDFEFVTQGGDWEDGDDIVGCSDNGVQVSFDTANVSNARHAWADTDTVEADHVQSDSNRLFSVIASGNGNTVRPDLLSAELANPNGSSDQMRFTFDENVNSDADETRFTAIYSDAPNEEVGDFAQVVSGNQVLVTFDDLSNRTEYVVGGSVDRFAVTAADSPPGDDQDNYDTGKPAGDNAGAFATGWTTGPDAVSASVQASDGQVTVIMDQRAHVDDENCAELVNSDGELFSSPSTDTGDGAASPGTPNVVPVTYQFAPSDLADAVGLYIGGTPGFLDFDDELSCFSLESPAENSDDISETWPNVDQVFSIR